MILKALEKLSSSLIICVEGNIGSGKSSLMQFCHTSLGIKIVEESIHKWKSYHGSNLLKLLYDDPKNYSFLFNQYILLNRLKCLKEHTDSIKMLERSVYSTFHIFVENNYLSGYLNKTEYNVLKEYLTYISKINSLKIDLFVYLRTSPEICMQRIKQRNRLEEQSLDINFIQRINDLHENLFMKNRNLLGAPVLVYDGNKSLEETFNQFKQTYDLINQDFVKHI